MSLYSQLFLRDTNSPYGDVNRNSTLSFRDLDQNFLFLKERDINQLRVDGSNLIYETLGGTEYSVNIGGASTNNTFVTGFTFNSPSTYDLTIEQNQGEPPLTVDLSSLASDVYVLSGSYNPSTGDVEFTNSTGGTFVVSGFTTGMTDTFVTGGTLTGTNLVLEKSNGVDTSTIDLSGLEIFQLSGDTNLSIVDNIGNHVILEDSSGPLEYNFIAGGQNNTISGGSTDWAVIVGGKNNKMIDGGNVESAIIGGENNTLHNGCQGSFIAAGSNNSMDIADDSFIGSGIRNNITGPSGPSAIIAGMDNTLDSSQYSICLGGRENNLSGTSVYSMISGRENNLSDTSYSVIVGSYQSNLLSTSQFSAIISGRRNTINNTSRYSGMIGGWDNTITASNYSGIFGGSGNTINGFDRTFILGGLGITATQSDTTYVPQLNIQTIGSTTPVTNLGIDASGNVVSGTSGEITTASNVGSGEGLFSGKSGTDLQFKSLTSTGGTVTISSTGSTVNLESSGGGLQPPTVPTQDVIPFMNTAGTDAEYQDFFKFDGTSLWVGEDANNYCKINDATGSITMLDGGLYNLTISPSAVSGGGKISSTTGALWIQSSTAGSYQLWLDRTNKRIGIYTSTPDSTLTVQGEGSSDTTSALKIKNDSLTTLFEVKDGGTVVIPNVGSTTPVTNLGIDASGNVVSGTTGGGGGLNYISAGAVATNLETTSNWDINGVYTGGTTATGSQGDCHVDSNYWFTCVATDTWIRLIRG